MKTSRFCLLALAASALATGQSQAANIFINDTAADDSVSITGSQFEGGFFVNGGPNSNGAVVTVPEANGPISFRGSWFTPGFAEAGSRTIYLVEAQDHDLISDILTWSWQPDTQFTGNTLITGSFVSDFEDNLGRMSGLDLPAPPAPGDIFVEDGNQVTFSHPFLTGEVASDVDPVPEPSTWAACGFVALLAGRTLWRRFRR